MNEDLLRDFLVEAGELLAELDNRLIELEGSPQDRALLNATFRSFHTIKGGAGFLGAPALVTLCHRTENLLDDLRNGRRVLDASLMDVILAATAAVRTMLATLSAGQQPKEASMDLLAALEHPLVGSRSSPSQLQPAHCVSGDSAFGATSSSVEPNWPALLRSISPHQAEPSSSVTSPPDVHDARAAAAQILQRHSRRATDDPSAAFTRAGRRDGDPVVAGRDTTLRIDTARLDHVLNLSGEIGLVKNRLMDLRSQLGCGAIDARTLHPLDEAVGQLDTLVTELQNAIMRTRMQPVRRLFQKYPRLVRDLARELGKDVDLHLEGEATELDRTMIEEMSDPLMHLVRNALDHGMESPNERRNAAKPEKGSLTLRARQSGDHILIEVADDGRGMRSDVLRRKAIEKKLTDPDLIRGMDDRQALQLIFLPGFSTKDQVTSVSGRGVGMDVVRANVQKLNGRIEISSVPGAGTTVSVCLPLTLAILPVLVVRSGEQPFALPLTMVREIVRLHPDQVASVSGKATLLLRDEVLPVRSLASMLARTAESAPAYGVVVQMSTSDIVVAVDGLVGRDDVVIKPLEGVKPKGIAGATLAADGSVLLVLDIEALLVDVPVPTRASLLATAA